MGEGRKELSGRKMDEIIIVLSSPLQYPAYATDFTTVKYI